jgi:hypothetical protein
MAAPGSTDLRILFIPDFRKLIQCQQRFFLGRGLVNFLQIRGDVFVVFPRHVLHRVTHHVHDAKLNPGLGVRRVNRVGKALEAVNAGDENILHTPILQLGEHVEPELGTVHSGHMVYTLFRTHS